MIHCVSHVDYTDPSLVVVWCGKVFHVNDPDVILLDCEAFDSVEPDDVDPGHVKCHDCNKSFVGENTKSYQRLADAFGEEVKDA
jgi:hypothetical protein